MVINWLCKAMKTLRGYGWEQIPFAFFLCYLKKIKLLWVYFDSVIIKNRVMYRVWYEKPVFFKAKPVWKKKLF